MSPNEPRSVAPLVPALALLVVVGCAVWASAVPTDQRGTLVAPLFTVAGFVVIAGCHTAQIYAAQVQGTRAREEQRVLWNGLLSVQTVLTVLLLVGDVWLWHGASGLLAGAALVVLPGRAGRWVAALLSVGLVPMAVMWSLEPHQLVHWSICHIVVTVGTWGCVRLVGSLRRQGIERREAAQNAREQERTQIATGLHDVLGRILVAITLKGELMRHMSEDGTELREQADGLVDLARKARVDVRSAVTSSWRTGVAEELVLAHAVLADAGVESIVEVPEDEVPPGVEWVLASALREAVTNVLVHSDARRVELRLLRVGPWVELRVSDDGTAGAAGAVVHGTGLRGVAARCAAVGGRMSTETGPAGFVLSCRVPVDP